jgi:large subunit ribosomal protein L10
MAKAGRLVKETLVQELSHRLAQQPDFFVTSVNRLKAAEADDLRRRLHATGASLLLVKQSLGRRAFGSLPSAGVLEWLEGSVGLVFPGDDPAVSIKAVVEFIKSHENSLTVRGGIVEAQVLDRPRVEQLANLPARPVLLAEVVGTLEAPIADVIFTLERLIGDIAWIAEQAAQQKPAEQAAAAPSAEAPKADVPAPESAPEQKPTTPPQEGSTS